MQNAHINIFNVQIELHKQKNAMKIWIINREKIEHVNGRFNRSELLKFVKIFYNYLNVAIIFLFYIFLLGLFYTSFIRYKNYNTEKKLTKYFCNSPNSKKIVLKFLYFYATY